MKVCYFTLGGRGGSDKALIDILVPLRRYYGINPFVICDRRDLIPYLEAQNIDYLNSVLYELEIASSLEELDYIKEELANGGYIKKVYKSNKKRDDLPSEPIKYEFNGVEILVGRNNLQNDKLTLKMAKKSYTWLHTKRIHGSHVIIKSDEVSDELLYYAATLAVKHSQGKNSSKVEVDYTLVKNVHKEIGAKPGMVIYTNYHTIIV